MLAVIYCVESRPSAAHVSTLKSVVQNGNALFNEDGSPVNNGKRSPYQLNWFDFKAYEDLAPTYVSDVLDDFWELGNRGFVYQPWVGFSEPPFSSKFVNVDTDARGFPTRRTVNDPNEQGLPTIRIYALGGSTTFGYNVSDEHTWVSYLSSTLNKRAEAERLGIHVEVVNYGRSEYTPSQETALLIDLLKSGHRPNLVIFMDGVNLSSLEDVPEFTDEIARSVKNIQFVDGAPLMERLGWIPLVRLANDLRRKLFQTDTAREEPPQVSKSRRAEQLVNMFESNREISSAVSTLYEVKTLFFLQPSAMDNYPLQLFRGPLPERFLSQREEAQLVYARLRGRNVRIDLADLFDQWGSGRKAIIDDVHYSPSFNRFLAERVANHIDLRSFPPRSAAINESKATGEPRRVLRMKE